MAENINKDIGMLPPTAIELEEAVLGACMLDKYAIEKMVEFLRPEAFYKEQHSLIYHAIVALHRKNQPVDIFTVVKKLEEQQTLQKAGGAYYLTQLTNRIASAANVEYHAHIIVQHFLSRELIRVSHENIQQAYDPTTDVFKLYSDSVARLEGIVSGVLKFDVEQVGHIHDKVVSDTLAVVQHGAQSGVKTGYRNLDNFTNGWQKSDLIIVAGRPAMGKSVVGLSFAQNAALQYNTPVALFSLEMSKFQVVGRSQSMVSEVDSSRIIKKQVTMEELRRIVNKAEVLRNAPLYIDDTPAISLMELKNKARKLVREKGVQLIVIDYLQLMSFDGSGKNLNREQEISNISRGLKTLAKELDIPIIALSQLSRAVESRGDKKPQLSDLRESGSIEQDADMVLFCFRPEYYAIDSYEMNNETLDSAGLMVLIVAKHRAGSLGELRFNFKGQFTRLDNYENYTTSFASDTRTDVPEVAAEQEYGRVNKINPAALQSQQATEDLPF